MTALYDAAYLRPALLTQNRDGVEQYYGLMRNRSGIGIRRKLVVWCIALVCAAAQSTARAADPQVSREDKRVALKSPCCVLPYGNTIDQADLPFITRNTAEWCSSLSNSTRLSMVSIPGTHDAGTALGRTGWTRCQVLTIPAQLALGVRGFDIRLRLVHRDLLVYHAEESQKLSFESVLTAMRNYLAKHRREVIVMRIREESKAIQASETFESAFGRYRHDARFDRLFYRATSRTEIPTVGQLRGKILILDNYGKLPQAIDYPNPTMRVQDDYDTDDMGNKAIEIISKLKDAETQGSSEVWNVNYTSSSTVKVDQLANAKAVNAKVSVAIGGGHKNLGLVLMNFPGSGLIQQIIDSNFGSAISGQGMNN